MFLLKFSITEENTLQAGTSNQLNQKICKIIFITKAKVLKIFEKLRAMQLEATRKTKYFSKKHSLYFPQQGRVRHPDTDDQKWTILFYISFSALLFGLSHS